MGRESRALQPALVVRLAVDSRAFGRGISSLAPLEFLGASVAHSKGNGCAGC